MTSHPPLEELRRAIVEAGYRFDRFAALIGERADYFNHQLSGRKPPKADLFDRAAARLNRSADELRPKASVDPPDASGEGIGRRLDPNPQAAAA